MIQLRTANQTRNRGNSSHEMSQPPVTTDGRDQYLSPGKQLHTPAYNRTSDSFSSHTQLNLNKKSNQMMTMQQESA
jgi:hypothetical protein